MTKELAIRDDQDEFDERQVAALQHIGMGGAHPGDLAVFFHQCKRTGLDPFARQIYMIARQGKQTIQTGIDGFRLIARRATDRSTGTLGYEDTQWADPNGQWHDVWLWNEPPAAARVTVVRDGARFPSIARFMEYAGRKRDGQLNQMWSTRPALMLEKCAEALALRKAFPQDLSGLYTSDEMQQATVIDHQPPAPSKAKMPPKPDPDRQLTEDQRVFAEQIEGMTDVQALRGLWRDAQALDMVSELAWRAVAVENLAERAGRLDGGEEDTPPDDGIETVNPEVVTDGDVTD
ncbi:MULTISPECIES: phage recombination protein Bet [unclassified Corynebacterium]|uniref:phage recombination protein Bet n=1 Tax=unclassified Corynebacterium TaxID=2624378 RepID=UPI004033694D